MNKYIHLKYEEMVYYLATRILVNINAKKPSLKNCYTTKFVVISYYRDNVYKYFFIP